MVAVELYGGGCDDRFVNLTRSSGGPFGVGHARVSSTLIECSVPATSRKTSAVCASS